MKALKFTLKGETAFFKDNSINNIYLSYGNIHRVALLGIFGAILGYGGYSQQNNVIKGRKTKKTDYPEFYEKLKDLKISIVSNGKYGTFPKKIQTFNNSVGYASKEEGGNLIVKQFWIENPSWDIYLDLRNPEALRLAEHILNKKAVYVPYLGSNDHFADICQVEEVELEENKDRKEMTLDSMINLSIDLVKINQFKEVKDRFKYMEYLPVTLSLESNQHIKEKMMITNMEVTDLNSTIYQDLKRKRNIIFY